MHVIKLVEFGGNTRYESALDGKETQVKRHLEACLPEVSLETHNLLASAKGGFVISTKRNNEEVAAAHIFDILDADASSLKKDKGTWYLVRDAIDTGKIIGVITSPAKLPAAAEKLDCKLVIDSRIDVE